VFYLALPALALMWRPILSAVLAAAAIVFCILINSEYVILNFAAGVLAAHLVAWRPRSDFMRSHAAACLSILFLCLLIIGHFYYFCLIHTLLLFPLFLAVCYGNTFFGLLSNGPAKLLGAISYSIYLLHCVLLHAIMYSVNEHASLVRMSGPVYWAIVAGVWHRPGTCVLGNFPVHRISICMERPR
jgi:peptidoglycan/LPS O-acetylase OafA/YrhL